MIVRHIPMPRVLLIVFLAAIASVSAFATQVMSVPNKVVLDLQQQELVLSEDSMLSVAGINRGRDVETVIVQIEDRDNPGYHNRVNKEFEAPPGPFRFQLPMGGLHAINKRRLDPENLRRVVVFTESTFIEFDRSKTGLIHPDFLPNGAIGWDFGPAHAPVMPGFTKITPQSPGVAGGKLIARLRPSGDALISDGISGIERVELPVPNGAWRVSIWTEDMGEWQMLPYWTRRSIAVNGAVVAEETRTAEEWFDRRYSDGAVREAILDGDPWDNFAGRRGDVVSAEIDVRDGRMTVEMSGDLSAAQYIAAILLAPASAPGTEKIVQQQRRELFLEKWRYEHPVPQTPVSELTVRSRSGRELSAELTRLDWRLGRGDSVQSDVWISAPSKQGGFAVAFDPGQNWPEGLDVELRYGLWQFRRASPAGTYLKVEADRLREARGAIRNAYPLARRLNLRAVSRTGVPPGRYDGALRIESGHDRIVLPISAAVIDVTLPALERPVGVFMEEAPHLTWFGAFKPLRERAIQCDLAQLGRFGLTGIAPPLAKTREEFHPQHLRVTENARAGGFLDPVISYASFKHAAKSAGVEAAALQMQAVDAALAARGMAPVHWSVTDEPSNLGDGYSELERTVSQIRRTASEVHLTGFLNNRKDRKILRLFDSVFINSGFGVDADDIEEVRAAGPVPWLYNMGAPRLAAGFYLWRSGAEGYLQWHGRMPTADPYDPTDGREDDFQYLYPSLQPCRDQEVHQDLLDMSEGITDLRWLTWLDAAARTDLSAARLLADLRRSVPAQWDAARRINMDAATGLRDRIKAFAVDAHRRVNG